MLRLSFVGHALPSLCHYDLASQKQIVRKCEKSMVHTVSPCSQLVRHKWAAVADLYEMLVLRYPAWRAA